MQHWTRTSLITYGTHSMSHIHNSLISHPTAKMVPRERESKREYISFYLFHLLFSCSIAHNHWQVTSSLSFHLLFALIFSPFFFVNWVIYIIAEMINISMFYKLNDHVENKSKEIFGIKHNITVNTGDKPTSIWRHLPCFQ